MPQASGIRIIVYVQNVSEPSRRNEIFSIKTILKQISCGLKVNKQFIIPFRAENIIFALPKISIYQASIVRTTTLLRNVSTCILIALISYCIFLKATKPRPANFKVYFTASRHKPHKQTPLQTPTMNPQLNKILKWSVENSAASAEGAAPSEAPRSTLDPEVLASLFGGPSEADLMKDSMSAILSTDPEMTMEARMIAFDNFEQLIENLDNANLMEPLKLWAPLISLLSSEESELRMMAAWCIGTAVQNNEKSQKMLYSEGGIPPLVDLAIDEKQTREVRRKAIYALSSAMRNFQDAMNEFVDEVKDMGKTNYGIVDAGDMDAVDGIINGLREEANKSA